MFKERKLSVQDYLSLKNKQSASGLGGMNSQQSSAANLHGSFQNGPGSVL